MNNSKDQSPDLLQQAWRDHLSESRITVNAELLQQEVQTDRDSFRSVIINHDVTEVLVALFLIPVWFLLGASVPSTLWTWYLAVPSLIGVPSFMLWHRWRNHRPENPDETLVDCVSRAIADQEDQIWLLRNVVWWYLLPFAVPIMIFFAHAAWDSRSSGVWESIAFFLVLTGFVTALYVFIYWLNQAAVRKDLIPKRDALQSVLSSLTNETTESVDEVSLSVASVASLSETKTEPPKLSLNRTVIGLTAFVLIIWGVLEFMGFAKDHPELFRESPAISRTGDLNDKRSPFDAVRWEELAPEVKLDDEWYRLVALDDTPAEDIVAFARGKFLDNYRKRFEEDLVEILVAMECPPGDTVKLELRSLDSLKTTIRPDVPMTREKRKRIFDANTDRQQPESQF